ncbi:hypothetical protein ASPCADRAFT_209513 [Aspergillus carbonarius ITEM 5010]|uniref:Uncharacterized protein n=1 Tax=Aspergillus carbonarius (strain ITEM 5010) TaxID=602072 RepID=A0A1R3RGH0_ASPC5|nr:hypothetical protein ASPCADRAFT_209513 [Aspergillus carbonarius ITEM 5010]
MHHVVGNELRLSAFPAFDLAGSTPGGSPMSVALRHRPCLMHIRTFDMNVLDTNME